MQRWCENWKCCAEISNHKQKTIQQTTTNNNPPTYPQPKIQSLNHTHYLLQELLLGGKTPTHVLRRALEQHSKYSDAEQPSSNKRTVVMVAVTSPPN